jgi:hypothetical protein
MRRTQKFDTPMKDAERKARSRALDTIKQAAALPVQIIDKTERRDLLVVMRQREKVALAEADAYRATLLAQFERKIAAIYLPTDHPVWAEAHAKVKAAEAEATATIRATFRELGIPERWAPRLDVMWSGRGENAAKSRRDELRHVAQAEAERRVKEAQAKIKAPSVAAQERVLAAGLSSEAAQAMLEALPAVAELLPPLEIEGIEQIAAQEREAGHRYRYSLGYDDS